MQHARNEKYRLWYAMFGILSLACLLFNSKLFLVPGLVEVFGLLHFFKLVMFVGMLCVSCFSQGIPRVCHVFIVGFVNNTGNRTGFALQQCRFLAHPCPCYKVKVIEAGSLFFAFSACGGIRSGSKLYQPTFLCWLRASSGTTTKRLPY